MSLDKDSISRLAVAFLEQDPSLGKFGDSAFQMIADRLNQYRVIISCSEEIRFSVSQQAALLTIINVGKRCFKGGVYIQIPEEVTCIVPWPENQTLNKIALSLGAKLKTDLESETFTELVLGSSNTTDTWRLLTNNWSCGIIPPGFEAVELPGEQNFPLGGIAGAALAIGTIFLRVAGFDLSIGSEIYGMSMWLPGARWNSASAQGPRPQYFPSQLWLLGLGHLGQAYAWLIGLLPFAKPSEFLMKLQDDDRLVAGNFDSGMLSELEFEKKYKTRVVATWLEARHLKTRIVERKYDENYFRQSEDPELLLAGLDKVEVRRMLKEKDFKLILDCGLGAGLNFDMIRFNVFPNLGIAPSKLWENSQQVNTTPNLTELTGKLVGCGYTVGIASAFTGCFSAAILISELLRSYHQGQKISHLYLSLREINNRNLSVLGDYGTETFSGVTSFA